MAHLRHPDASETDIPGLGLSSALQKQDQTPSRDATVMHPSGKQSHGRLAQVLRVLAFFVYFFICCVGIVISQTVGAPLYFIKRDWFYPYMAMTKRSFALTTTVMTQIWGPTTIRISGDESVAGQIRMTKGGGVEFRFPERLVLVANHQIYTDWLYLWWIGYANRPGMHGHLYIILKESLKYIPFIGPGMMFYGFIFMSRKMATDQPRLAHRLNKLNQKKTDPRGRTYLDPMWLLLFPEGTNLSTNGRTKSAQWAKKNGLKDPEHVMLPRSTGTFFCLNELKGTVEYVYDCTVAYEGVPRGKYGEQFFGLGSTYFQGRPPKSVNLYWRRFRLADMPLDDAKKFDSWLREQWYKKDELMEEYLTTGRFPAMAGSDTDYVETAVRTRYPWEILQVFTMTGIVFLIWYNVKKLVHAFSSSG
ncbi:acyltransferase domain-containing protein [Hirsutella rhossiliensis]|uniref:Acyltransferase domain-containing protein n=1 Tax=Hirsutella rhossiliensis TaxID=111463 RepID=A0A9P8SKF6_9HYPO|nr:acyltransferase domain-containing protein [Hirsutella rhossiliensis]KAH0964700.1 acyltransferase domain-containing protein [Hirsutella rhossiliensis]